MTKLSELFLHTISQYNMLQPGDRVCVGFSGGADSACLLSLFYQYRDQLGIELSAAHVNHCLRGEESDADESFVRDFCAEREIPLHVYRADVSALSKACGESIELTARRVRYDFFASINAEKIATAHTGSDAVETMLLNLSRGASLHGLTAIPPVRGNIIRPLICFTRKQTEDYCRENRIAFRTDRSNDSDAYTRNRVRHHVIPPLQEIFPAFEETAIRCIRTLKTEDDYMEQEAKKQLSLLMKDEKLPVAPLMKLHPAMCARVLSSYISSVSGAAFETVHLDLILNNLDRKGYALTLPGNIGIQTDGDFLFICDSREIQQQEYKKMAKDKPETVFRCGYRLDFKIMDAIPAFHWNCEYIDFHKIDDIIEIRAPMTGDRVHLSKRNCTKTLKKLYTEMKIPAAERKNLPVIADSRGVIWAYGAGVDRTRLADENTEKIMIIRMESCKSC